MVARLALHPHRPLDPQSGRVVTVDPNSTDADEVGRAIDTYEPLRDVRAWVPIAAFVRTSVKSVHPYNVRKAREYMMAAARYIDWCVTAQGLRLSDDLFSLGLAEAYVHSADMTARLAPRSRALASGHLSDLIRRIVEERSSEVVSPRSYRSHPSDAYTVSDLAKLHAWARTRRVGRVKRNAYAILALGLGFGLNGADMMTVRADDLSDRGASGVLLTLADRSVWCDQLHEPSVREVLASASPGALLIQLASNQSIHDFLHTARRALRPIDSFVPELNRLRVTWFLRRASHFSALRAVMDAYKIQHASTLQTIVEQLPLPSDAEVRRVLRTGELP